jgi:GNAT superfamily N-acetyltransferase
MSNAISCISAAAVSLDLLATTLTRAFEGYFYPMHMNGELLARRVRVEQIDLHASSVLLVDGEPAGAALLAVRGERSWCGGFGVAPPFRGLGLAHQLCTDMLQRARAAGARECQLEVLTRNQRALHTYTRAGMRPLRDLLLLEWRAAQAGRFAPPSVEVLSAAPEQVLQHYHALHSERASWQRELPSLLARTGSHALVLPSSDAAWPYILFAADTQTARVVDIGAHTPDQAEQLLRALQVSYAEVVCVNEPADGSLLPAYYASGFSESDRQHELLMEL